MADNSLIRVLIKDAHGCDSKHVGSVVVVERIKGRIVWDGKVEVFALIGHPKAKRCYAWGIPVKRADGQPDAPRRTNFWTILGIPPVDSPRKAVQSAIASDFKKSRKPDK